ncbi:hypothetical protein [Enterobacter kobei]|uniref:hypothetical protein n=1 Tax=Enterobacter kobei TaxID=208224 RepID=UPI003CF4E79C
MDTNYHEGLHILLDSDYQDRNCIAVKTSLSNHMVCAYTTTMSSTEQLLSGVVMSNKGILNLSFPIADLTTHIQQDADIAPVDGTDSFIAVWSSNAAGRGFHIYMRSFTLDTAGELIDEAIAVQVSQSNGNYFAPRVVYNKATETVMVMWISATEKAIQYKAFRMNANGSFSDASYEASLNDEFKPEYYSLGLDLRNSESLSIAFLNAGDKVLAVAQKDANTLGLYTLEPGDGGVVEQVHLSDYSATDIRTFSVAYDSATPSIKVVYSTTGITDIYGDSIAYFPGKMPQTIRANPVVLNLGNQRCSRPAIKRTTPIDSAGNRYFIVAWETMNAGVFYNEFTSTWAQVGVEQEINRGDIATASPHIVVTSNQRLIVVNASHYNAEPLSGKGILYNVETHQSA